IVCSCFFALRYSVIGLRSRLRWPSLPTPRRLCWLTGLLWLSGHLWHRAHLRMRILKVALVFVPVLLPEGPQPAQCLKGCVEVVVDAVVTIWGNIQEEWLKIWEGRYPFQERKEPGEAFGESGTGGLCCLQMAIPLRGNRRGLLPPPDYRACLPRCGLFARS